MITQKEQVVYDILDELCIKYDRYEHGAVYTVEEVNELDFNIPGMGLKNLFVRNKKGNEHYLVILEDKKRLDLKELSKSIGTTSLSFASKERLDKYLGLTPGAVTPFGLINDKDKSVKVILDKDILVAEKVGFHPNVNTSTIVIDYNDFNKYLNWCKNEFSYIEI
ncbi:MAG: prolyl-tRNA synthetase associated domain-containing protein [Peptostreptococcaceae bacterium]